MARIQGSEVQECMAITMCFEHPTLTGCTSTLTLMAETLTFKAGLLLPASYWALDITGWFLPLIVWCMYVHPAWVNWVLHF